MSECLVIGSGIIGLAIADRLRTDGHSVTVVARTPAAIQVGGARSASMAAGGILPPPITRAAHDPLEQLRTLSHQLFFKWARDLQTNTGIDVDLDECGGLYLATSIGEALSLQAAVSDWRDDGVQVEELSVAEAAKAEPLLDLSEVRALFRLPDEARVRPAGLMQALTARLSENGVPFREANAVDLRLRHDFVELSVDGETVSADEIIVAAGPWSTQLLIPLGFDIGVEPRRGQIAKWQMPSDEPGNALLGNIVNVGPRYVMCRSDGELIAGSTVEESEFDCQPTDEGIASLVEFARSLIPALREMEPSTVWAGLRPHARDGVPSIGRVKGIENLLLATGHFRSGIHLAPATAYLISQILSDQPVGIPMRPYAARRN